MVVESRVRPMVKRGKSPNDIERLEYIGDMLVELDEMAQRAGFLEISLLIGAAALAAVELAKDLTSLRLME